MRDSLQQRETEATQAARQEAQHRRVSSTFGVLRMALFAFAMLAVVQTFRDDPVWLPRAVVPATVLFVVVVVLHRRVQARRETARRRAVLAEEAALRLRGGTGPGASSRWPAQPCSDLDAGAAHLGAAVASHELPEWTVTDLGIEGSHSLLQVLNTTQSTLGARRLRRMLRSPLIDADTIRARQDAVQELVRDQGLRDALLLAFFEGRATPMRRLPGFLSLPRVLPGGLPRWLVAASALATLPLVVLGIQSPVFLPFAVVTLLPGLLVRVRLRGRTTSLRDSWLEMGPVLRMIEHVGAALRRAEVSSPILRAHGSALQPDEGTSGMRPHLLRRWITLLRLHEIGFLYGIIDFLTQWDLHWLFALEAEAGERRPELEALTAGLVELEGLLALAVWSAEQEGVCVPEVLAREVPSLSIRAGEHPLLPHDQAVANDLQLGESVRVELVTGSNMAGKSTFLRMVLLNTLLAQIGAAVRAVSMEMTPLRLQANINVSDSLADGKSYFLVEVERVRDMLQVATASPFVFTVFDELFRGTNSNERLAASREIARLLAEQGGLCLLATHDLELTRLVSEESVEGMAVVHFTDEIRDGRMVFPYVAHRGVSTAHNALRLLELTGYPPDLVERAQRYAAQRHPDASPGR